MPARFRLAFVLLVSGALAAVLPVYPLNEETRSFMPGSGGDQIRHDWSLSTLPGALQRLRYRSDSALPRALLLAWFAVLGAGLAALGTRAIGRPRR